MNWEIETDVYIPYVGKESKKRVDVCIRVTDSLSCVPETNTTTSNKSTISNKN